MGGRKLPSWLIGVLGVVGIIAIWWVISLITAPTQAKYNPIPSPPEVVQAFFSTGIPLIWQNFSVTLGEAGLGFIWGNVIGLLLAAIVLLIPALKGVVMQIAVVTYCLPIVAIGPIVLIILGGATNPGDLSSTAVFLAALSVIFTTVVGSLLGLRAADQASLDVITVYGGSKLTQLTKVRLIAALPSIFNALQMAVPAAFLGAVLGEYFGKIDVAVGPMLVNAQQKLNSPVVWMVFLLCAILALAGYALTGLIGRWVTPWAKKVKP